MLRLLMALCLAGLAAAAGADNATRPPALLLVPGLYGLTDDSGARSSHIHPDFLRAMEMKDGKSPAPAIQHLTQRFNEAFAAEKVERITPANKYRTYAVSLEVLRADQYQVKRPDGTVDIYLPVSVRLYVTSILSGEVLFSRALTSYRNLREAQDAVASGASASRIDAAYRENLDGLVDKVIAETREQFRPFQISARVMARPLGLYVVDRGMDAGIARGTELVNAGGAGIRILYAGKGYAVGESTLGDIAEGEELAMYSTAAAGDIVKPRALVMDADAPEDLAGDYAAVQFSENLGSRAAFTVVPVNPDFQSVLRTVSGTDGLQQAEVTQKRVPPDYFVRLKLPEPVVYEMPTSKGFSKLRVLVGTAWAELLDQQGRVIYVTHASEQIEDQILEGGIAFDSTDRRKVLYGNLLKTLSEQFIRDVRFRQDVLTVADASDKQVLLADPQHRLSGGQDVRLYHSLSLSSVGAEPVLVPVWDMTSRDRAGANMVLEPQLPVTGKSEKVRKGDVALLQVTSDAGGQAQTAALCPSVQDKSTVALGDLRALAYFAFGNGSRLQFFGGTTSLSYNFLTLDHERDHLRNAGFAREMKEVPVNPMYCFQPLVKVDELSRNCDDATGLCDIQLQLVAGVSVLRSGEAVTKKILMAKSQLKNVPKADSDLFVRTQAAEKLFPMLADSVRQLEIPTDPSSPSTAQGK